VCITSAITPGEQGQYARRQAHAGSVDKVTYQESRGKQIMSTLEIQNRCY
jgi:hypothetical protein